MDNVTYIWLWLLSVLVGGLFYLTFSITDDLREDVSRVSRIQVQCAGEIDYGQCVDLKLTEWSEGR